MILTINNINRLLNSKNLTEYQYKTLIFCQEFLSDKELFTIKTSGSTGLPKDILIKKEQMIASAEMTCNFLNLEEKNSSLICISTEYIGGKMMLVRGILKNMEMYLIEPASNPLKNIDIDIKFDFLSFVPLQINNILTETPEKINILDKAKAIIIGGGEISETLAEKIQKISAPVYSTYGMTETVSHIALKKINGCDKQNYFSVLEKNKISLDSRGCLVINSPVTNNEDVITNDMVEIIDNNKFIWLGRVDNVINSGGIKIQAEILENKIKKLFDTNNISNLFFIKGEKDDKLGEKITIHIENNLSLEEQNKIKSILKEFLSKYEYPKEFYFIKQIKLTETGKIKRI